MTEMTFWGWYIVALVLVILEVFAPGAFFLWIGISAAITGTILWIIPSMDWQYQLIVFAVFSVVSIIAWRSIARNRATPSDQPTLNRRGEQYVGRVFTLDEPVVNGIGKLTVDDSTWKIEGDDCEAGTRVKVSGVDGVILRVERA
jgi:hypothetical protein